MWAGGVIGVIVALCFAYYFLLLDWQGRPFCHRQIMLAFKTWMQDNGMDINSNTNPFPNVRGGSRDSLAAINGGMNGYMKWASDYRYVPGLHEDDPGDLVLMYVDRPTRWTWHGPPPTVFKAKAWIIMPVDFASPVRQLAGPGELSERVPENEFKRRLNKTVEFVRANRRPNWEITVAEHSRFLASLEHEKK